MSFVETKLISKVQAKNTGLVMMSSFLASSILLRHEQRLTQFTFQDARECSRFLKILVTEHCSQGDRFGSIIPVKDMTQVL